MSKAKGMDELRDMEARWRRRWEESGTYRYDPTRSRDETFVVDTPPPTVSGSLHIGHVFSYTHTDLMVRYRRMQGDNVFYPMGWDDNGLPTERRVQNVFNVRCDPSLPYDPSLSLAPGREGETLQVARRNFIELCDRVVQEDEKQFKELWQRLGLSIDWSETYATIDRRSRYVSQLSFLHLLESGEAELREAPTMWDVDYQTAVAQAEVEDREREGVFHRIRFDVEGGESFTIATTRPELLPACVAVVAHPEDERYRHLFGKRAITPLFHSPVPIYADESAEPEKGTGVLMVCTFGDAADVEKWRRLDVPAREVIGRDGRIAAAAWGEDPWETLDAPAAQKAYDELTSLFVNQARRRVVELLDEADALDGDAEKTRQFVKYYERGERPLEFVVTRQWFVKILDKKERLLEQGRRVTWHPDFFRKRYEDWVEGLNQDWCVSRQRYFGVPIPVWYRVREDGSIDRSQLIVPPKDMLPVDPAAEPPPGFDESQRGQPGGFIGEADVFDTWATSSLTPLITSGWPDDRARHERLYPTSLRPQSHEIIRTWAFYTITRSMLMDGSIPWDHVAISGWVVDPDRKKMSKSKGNVVLPTDLIDDFGADAVRYWAASARLGVDTTFDTNVMREGKRLVTKIKNAARFVLAFEGEGGEPEHPTDRALVARLRDLVEDVTARWDDWDHAGALAATEAWFWGDFCDNYLEMAKGRAYAGDTSAIGTLRLGLSTVLRLFAPVLPHITDEVWENGFGSGDSIHRASWPRVDELPGGEDDGRFDAAVEVLTQVRRKKSEAKVSLRTPVDHLDVRAPHDVVRRLEGVMDDVVATLNAGSYALVVHEGSQDIVAEASLGEIEKKA
ncbi:MAG TPA: valine--tRNA ligase [Actinomycetota bacterium]|nr:valine--tRNA ligase [Actinomycetota bacterium]